MPAEISALAALTSPQPSTFTHFSGLEVLVVLEEVLDLVEPVRD